MLLAASAASAQDSRADYLRLFDADGDNRVSETEYLDHMGRGFAAMDRDGNGVIDRDELPGGRGQPISLEAHRANLREQFHRLDKNHDGRLDAAELTAPPG